MPRDAGRSMDIDRRETVCTGGQGHQPVASARVRWDRLLYPGMESLRNDGWSHDEANLQDSWRRDAIPQCTRPCHLLTSVTERSGLSRPRCDGHCICGTTLAPYTAPNPLSLTIILLQRVRSGS